MLMFTPREIIEERSCRHLDRFVPVGFWAFSAHLAIAAVATKNDPADSRICRCTYTDGVMELLNLKSG